MLDEHSQIGIPSDNSEIKWFAQIMVETVKDCDMFCLPVQM